MEWEEIVKIVLALLAAAVIWLLYSSFKEPPPPPKKTAAHMARELRKEKWAEPSGEIQISETETIKRVKLYGAGALSMFPTICYIYSNRETRTSHMVCPTGEAALEMEPEE